MPRLKRIKSLQPLLAQPSLALTAPHSVLLLPQPGAQAGDSAWRVLVVLRKCQRDRCDQDLPPVSCCNGARVQLAALNVLSATMGACTRAVCGLGGRAP